MTTYDVFISYSSEDARYAEWLEAMLRGAGLTVYFDRRGLLAGEHLPKALSEAVKSSRVLCAVVTPRYGKSWFTRFESESMKAREGILAPTRVIPCLFEGEPPVFLGERRYIDFRTRKVAAAEELVGSIRKHLADHDQRSETAKAVGAAVTVVGILAWLSSQFSSSDSSVEDAMTEHDELAEATWESLTPGEQRSLIATVVLDHYARTERLRDYLVQLGVSAPRSKADRVAAVIATERAPQSVLRKFFTYKELQRIAKEGGESAGGKAAEIAARIVRMVPA